MGGIVNGFNTGFHTVNKMERQKVSDERYEEQTAKSDSRYQDSMNRQAKYDEQADTTFKNQQADRVTAQADKKYNDGQVKKSHARGDRDDAYNQRKINYADVNQWAANAFAADPTGANITQEQYLTNREKAKGTNAEILFDVNKQNASKYIVDQVKKGFKGTNGVHLKESMNTYLSGQIDRKLQEDGGMIDKNGVPVTAMEFEKWEARENGGLVAHVRVTNADGEVSVEPVSKYRSAEGDDPIRLYDADKVFNHLIAENKLIGQLSQTGFLKQMTAPQFANSKSDNPAKVKEVQAMARAMNISEGDAWALNQNKQDPAKYRTAALEMAMKQVTGFDGQFIEVVDENGSVRPATDDDENIRLATAQDAENIANRYVGYIGGGGGVQGSGNPAPTPTPDKTAAIQQAKAALAKLADQPEKQKQIIARLKEMGITMEEFKAAQ